MKIVLQLAAAALALSPLDCRSVGAPEGSYQRSSFSILNKAGQKMGNRDWHLDRVGDALPSTIKIVSASGYEIDAGVVRLRGAYRMEGDSIFFDDRGPNGTTVVSIFGRVSGDTLRVRMPVVLMAIGGEPGMDLRATYVRSAR